MKQQLTNTLTTVTSQSHDLPVAEPTITYLLGIVDFGQVKQYHKTKKMTTAQRTLSRRRMNNFCLSKLITFSSFLFVPVIFSNYSPAKARLVLSC